jgi:prepilin-type N-terminal cleavage/methylation domain-containing protein
MIPRCSHRTNQGFTLIELLVAMVMGLAVLGAVLSIFVNQNRTHAIQQEVAYAQQNVRAAMGLIVWDIRNAGHDPANGGFGAIGPATSTTSIQVRADYSNPADGDAGDADEDITYTVNASDQLTRDDANDALGPEPIVDFVDSLQFSYVFADGDTGIPNEADADDSNDRDDIRLVMIRLGVRTENPDPDSGQDRVRNLANRVRIRNMGFQDIE